MNLDYEVAVSVVNADLLTELAPVPVRWSVPNPAPDQFIAVFRVGSAAGQPWQDPAALNFHCYAGDVGDSPKPAHELAARLKTVLGAMADRNNRVSHVAITGEAYLQDAATGRPRVIVGATVTMRPR